MLDNLYDEYEKLVNDVMKDHDKLLREGLDLFAQTASDVQDVIKITAEEHGYEMTAEMGKIIASIESMRSLDTYLGVGGTITQSLGDIANEVRNAYVGISSDMQGLKDAIASIGYQGKYDTADTDHTYHSSTDTTANSGNNIGNTDTSTSISTGNNSQTIPNNLPSMNVEEISKKKFIDNLLRNGTNTYDPKTTSSLNKYIYSKYGSALSVEEMAKLSGYLGFNYTVKQLAAENPNHSARKMKMLEKLKEFEKIYGFSNGGIVPDDALKVRDIGVKPASNGDDRLVALKPKESVFNEKQTKMIQEYVNKTPDYKTVMDMGTHMDKIMKMPEVQKRPQETNVKVEYDNVNINLPNVMNYEDFMNHAKKDQNFEKMINCMISSRMGLGRRLDKLSVNFRH